MQLKEIDTSKLLFNINAKTFVKDIEEAIPALKELDFGLPKKKVYQYLVLMYDIGSPMSRDISNYYQKKYKCAEVVGFPKNSQNKYEKDVTNMLIGKNEAFNKAASAYLAHTASPEYSQLVALHIILSEEMKNIFRGEIDDKSDQTLDRVTQRMKSLTREIYGSGEYDEVAAARRALYEQIEKSIIKLRPEDIAEVLAEGRDLPKDFNPYDDGDYKVEPMSFIADDEEMAKRILTEKDLGKFL